MLLPEDPTTHARLGTELCTIAGVTYVALPDGATLPSAQPAEIAASVVNPVTVTTDLAASIKAASPHVALINARVVEQIREKYSADDELKLLRLGPSADFTAYTTYVESCRAWGAAEKAALGL